MIINFNPNVSSRKKRKMTFGDERSANLVKNTIQAALNVKDPKFKMSLKQAFERIGIAIKSEDKKGKSILKQFLHTLE